MMIRYTANGSASIEGSQKEMEVLSATIIEFIESENKLIRVALVTQYDPSPYEEIVSALTFSKSSTNEITINDSVLIFSGTKDFFESVAKNLPYEVEETPYHIHYDFISFPQYLTPETLDIVFEATH